MGLKFTTGSSTALIQSAPLVTAPPFTVAMWAMFRNANGGTVWSMGDGAGTTGWDCTIVSSSLVRIGWWDSSTTTANGTANASMAVNEWFFVIARFIASNNRRLAVMPSGTWAVGHDFNTVGLTVSATKMALGCFSATADSKFSNSAVGEFWITDGDIGDPAAPLDDDLVRQLALYGPLSVPHVAPLLTDYLSLRSDALMLPGEVFQRAGRRAWTIQNAPSPFEHPPIHGHYQRPCQSRRLLVI